MAVNVQFCIEHHYFCDALYVWMKWEFPFLPRIGESVSPWFWIEEGTYDPDKIKSMFTSEGLMLGKVTLRAGCMRWAFLPIPLQTCPISKVVKMVAHMFICLCKKNGNSR